MASAPPIDLPLVLDTLDVGVVVQDAERRVLYANARAGELLGVPRDTVVARTTEDREWDVIRPDGSSVLGDEHPGPLSLRTGEPVRGMILGVLRGDTRERSWIVVSAIPERDATGAVARVVITFSDVSTAQRAMREQEATYQSVFRSMSEGLVVHNMDGSIRSANAAAERILGLTVDQLTGRAATDPRWRLEGPEGGPVGPGDIPSEIARTTGQPVSDRVLGVRRPTGERSWLQVRADPLREVGDDTPRGVVATFTDVTVARETAVALEASRAQMQRLLDAVPGIVYQYLRPREGPDRVTRVAGRIQEVLGLEPAVVHARPEVMFELLADDARAELMARIDAAATARTIFEHEVAIDAPGGGVRWLKVHGIPDLTDEGVLYTGVIMDVTHAHELADALRSRQRREAMGEMAAGIAHNFNNMLAVILPNIELARADLDHARAALLDDAERAALNAADLVRRMLALGRTDSPDDDATVDLVPIVHEAVHICRQTFDRSIRVEAAVELAQARVRGRASAIQQVVLNLCLNARDALEGRPEARLFVHLTPDGERGVRLTVQDNGRGMSPDVLRRLGEPFFTTKGPGAGTGLGVASAFHTINEAGGAYHVLSEPGLGSTFTVHLPLVRESAGAAPRTAPTRGAPSGRILVVDDEPMVREALVRLLARLGYSTLQAGSAAQALGLLADGPGGDLRAIFLDLSMPGMRGTDALPSIRRLAPDVPVVVLSGQVAAESDTRDAAAVLLKPVGMRELQDTLARVVRSAPSDHAVNPGESTR